MIEAGQPIGVEQPASFAFTAENMDKAKVIIAKYPEGKFSAVMPLLHLAQEQHGWLPTAAIIAVANMLNMPQIKAFEVAAFYTMYNRRPVGTHHIQVCTTTPCWLRGSADIVDKCKEILGIGFGETTADGKFSLVEVECLGACVNAPMVQVNNDYYEDLTPEIMQQLIADLAAGRPVKTGSQTGRQCSCAAAGATTLKDCGND